MLSFRVVDLARAESVHILDVLMARSMASWVSAVR